MINILWIEFPITGQLRLILLVMEWILAFSCFELSIYFVFRYKKESKKLKDFQDLAFFALFMGLSLMRFFFLISSYYSSDFIISAFFIWRYGSFRLLFLNLGFLSIIIGVLFFTFFMEKYKKILFIRYFFSSLFIIQLIILLVLFFYNLEILYSLSILLWIHFIIFSIIYNLDFIKKMKIQKIIQKGGLKITLIIFLLLVGYFLSMDEITKILGLEIRLIGIILQIIAINLVFLYFRNIPPFFEFDWQDKIENIFIMNKDGLCLYSKSYTNNIEALDRFFITGSLTSVNIMLNEIINTKDYGLSVIKKRDKIINIFTSENLTGVLISKEELEFFKHNLINLILKVEKIYHNILLKWNGDLSIFSPIENIIDEIFSL